MPGRLRWKRYDSACFGSFVCGPRGVSESACSTATASPTIPQAQAPFRKAFSVWLRPRVFAPIRPDVGASSLTALLATHAGADRGDFDVVGEAIDWQAGPVRAKGRAAAITSKGRTP